MADINLNLFVPGNNAVVPLKLHDNGDGSYSLTTSGGTGGGAATIADGADVAEGATTDAAVTNPASAASVVALLKGDKTLLGALTETAPATDTASSGLNGRLQRIAQRLTSLLALIPASLGQKTKATSLAVTLASDEDILATLGATTGAAVITDANGTLQQYLRGLVKLLITSGTIVLGAGANAIGKLAANAGVNIGVVGGTTIETSDETTRVADANAYAVGDVISSTVSNTGTTVLQGITVAAANGGTGYLTKFRLMTDQSACVAVIRVHFYTVSAPATVVPGDNVAMGLAYANRAQRIGAIDLPALATELGTVSAARTQDLSTRLAFQCDPADTKIYYRLETQTVFTPASGQKFYLAITQERNAG